jgi:hypothetical protein
MYDGLPILHSFSNFYVNNSFIFVLSRSVRVVDGKLYHPDGTWDPDIIYVTVYSKRELQFL